MTPTGMAAKSTINIFKAKGEAAISEGSLKLTEKLANGSTKVATMAIGKKAMMQSLKGKTGWVIAACTSCVELGLLYRSYLKQEGGSNFKMTYLKKAGAIIASQAVANVGAGAGWGLGTFIGASLAVYFGINAVVATCTAGIIASFAGGYTAQQIADKILSYMVDEKALEKHV